MSVEKSDVPEIEKPPASEKQVEKPQEKPQEKP